MYFVPHLILKIKRGTRFSFTISGSEQKSWTQFSVEPRVQINEPLFERAAVKMGSFIFILRISFLESNISPARDRLMQV